MDSWKYVPEAERRYTAALMRHFEAYRAGQYIDEESGMPHIAHVACNAMFLSYFNNLYERATTDEDTGISGLEDRVNTGDGKSCDADSNSNAANYDQENRVLYAVFEDLIAVLNLSKTHESARARLYDVLDLRGFTQLASTINAPQNE